MTFHAENVCAGEYYSHFTWLEISDVGVLGSTQHKTANISETCPKKSPTVPTLGQKCTSDHEDFDLHVLHQS